MRDTIFSGKCSYCDVELKLTSSELLDWRYQTHNHTDGNYKIDHITIKCPCCNAERRMVLYPPWNKKRNISLWRKFRYFFNIGVFHLKRR